MSNFVQIIVNIKEVFQTKLDKKLRDLFSFLAKKPGTFFHFFHHRTLADSYNSSEPFLRVHLIQTPSMFAPFF